MINESRKHAFPIRPKEGHNTTLSISHYEEKSEVVYAYF